MYGVGLSGDENRLCVIIGSFSSRVRSSDAFRRVLVCVCVCVGTERCFYQMSASGKQFQNSLKNVRTGENVNKTVQPQHRRSWDSWYFGSQNENKVTYSIFSREHVHFINQSSLNCDRALFQY
uniref:Uncharacterized protein n=1 Tax=Cacopsylla melanoneura TaxID=428564 RepID=A0A8D8XZV2_9HEMI